MPYVSQGQAGFFHTHRAQLERQGVDVGEWDQASRGMHLPKRVKKAKKPRTLEQLYGDDRG